VLSRVSGGCPGGQHLIDTQRCQNHGPVRLLVPLLEFNLRTNGFCIQRASSYGDVPAEPKSASRNSMFSGLSARKVGCRWADGEQMQAGYLMLQTSPRISNHPHMLGGENSRRPGKRSPNIGPSPRGWGEFLEGSPDRECTRTIPTRVGRILDYQQVTVARLKFFWNQNG
jgi:hypothetical protein